MFGFARQITIVLLLCIANVGYLSAFNGNVDQFRLNFELPSRSVQCITQDKQGLIWIGTNDWVAYYDGYSLQTLPLPQNVNHGFYKRIYSLQNDTRDRMWIGTPYGAFRYDKRNREIVHFLPNENDINSKSNVIYSIALSPDNQIWLGTRNGIYQYDEPSNKLLLSPLFAHHKTFNEALKSERIAKCIYFDKMGLLWVGTEGNGLVVINTKDRTHRSFHYSLTDSTTISSDFIENIYEDSFGSLWIATADGLCRLRRDDNNFERYNQIGINGLVTDMTEDKTGTLFLATDNGVAIFNKKEQSVEWLKNNPGSENTLLSNDVMSIYKDRSGAIWCGTSKGVCRIERQPRFPLLQNLPESENSLSNNSLIFLQADKAKNQLWIGTANAGIDRYDVATGLFTHYSLSALKLQPGYNQIRTGILLQNGNLLLGTGGGLLEYNTLQNTIYPKIFNPQTELKEIYALLESRNGDIWMGVLDKGLYRYDNKSNKVEEVSLPVEYSGKKDVYTNIKVLFEDSENNIWIVFYQGGIGRYSPANKTLDLYTQTSTHNGLNDNIVWDIVELPDKMLVFATGSGISFFNLKTKTFGKRKNFNAAINGSVTSILPVWPDYLWLGTEQGIVRISMTGNNIIRFSERDGLQGPLFNYQVAAALPPYLYFGGNNGFNKIDTRIQFDNSFIPWPSVLKIQNDNGSIDVNQLQTENNIPALSLSSRNHLCEIAFSAYSYQNEWRNRYQYKILPKDSVWKWVTFGKNSIMLPSLKSGKYTLMLRGANSDGKWGDAHEVLIIRVKSFWAIVIWSILGAIALFGFLLYLLNKRYPHILKNYQKILSKKKNKVLKNPVKLKEPDEKNQKIVNALIATMETDHLYTNKRLNKAQLAAVLKLTELQLAQILKEYIGKGFADFVNYYRVEAVKEKLKDPKYKDITLMGVADECGFNSKTSFYRVFKEVTGITPADYLEQLKNKR
ncbi:MAG: helix-turn-helix domain-containing protein [Tannerella sp.]|uniref:two-component regulator propeller domain-containing protein n=1 Tax=Coprobacter fastidiosus TaxID=1099853 RepID=UPI003AB1C7F8|nr:helix-turn-helix domain-containing protein [Tannerella sp.]